MGLDTLKQSLVRDLLWATQEIKLCHDPYRLEHVSKKLMNLTEAYANEALTMVEELESVDCSTCEHKIIMSSSSAPCNHCFDNEMYRPRRKQKKT